MMHANDDDAFGVLIRKLERLAILSDDDRQAVRSLPFTVHRADAQSHLVREGDEVTTVCLLLNGSVCRYKTTDEGGRQIVSFHIAGDLVDLQHLLLSRADHNIQAITQVTFAAVPAAMLKEAAQARSALAEALWRDTLIDASVFREWVLNVGRRDAKSRVAHMLCEFAARREAAGLGGPTGFEVPLTHDHIADATGLTPVHVNRTLALLKAEGLIALDLPYVQILDWAGIQRTAGFSALYLHASAA